MGFISALAHALIGYGIRRKVWGNGSDPGCLLRMNDFNSGLVWLDDPRYGDLQLGRGDPCLNLTVDDLAAMDWEVV